MVWLHEQPKHDLDDLVFYLPFHTRVEFLRIAVHCLMIKILAKNIRQHSKLNMMIEMNLK